MSTAAPGAVEPFALGPALLFCPGDRPERFAKAAQRADAVILDLEDAVAPEAKPAARAAVAAADFDVRRTVVRINACGTEDFAADAGALAGTEVRYVMLPKAESPDDVAAVVAALPAVSVVALCETARGVLAAPELAAQAGVVALMWGAEDLIASLGGTSSRHRAGTYRDVARHARSTVLLAARAHGRGAIDAIHTDIADADAQYADALDAAASGFTATACIHPDQVGAIRSAYAPTAEQLDWARRLLTAAEEAGTGVFRFEGAMVDEPILRHARLLASRGERS
ncbi:HpcH/HpaI aldolase/citrate lyase family protein [Pseudactinotalea sp. Z1739]|uniref:HpcH/HpaI aldolase/citrate lyase family protein n=1 Tax=Pseudactinotalea sp. Z1739 TaxID=3413028 RepID=UPI003C7CF04C